MIAKCTQGQSAYGGLAYDSGPGRNEEHHNPHQVAGTVAGRSWRERAYAMDLHARSARPEVQRPIHRTALRLAEEDRRLTDREWRQVAERYAREMGFQDCPWVAMRHGEEHIHVTVCRVRWDGSLASESHDRRRSHSAARAIERAHGLVDASERSNRGRPQVQGGERARVERTGEAAPRDVLRARVDEAVRSCNGSRDSYEAALRERGVTFVANEASTGRMNGYRYGLGGHRDPTGEQVWFKGSQLGRDYRWSATEQRLARQQMLQPPAREKGAGGKTRSALERIRQARGERPEAARTSSQEPAPRLAPTKGDNVERKTGPDGATDPRRERRTEPAGREADGPTGARTPELQPPTGARPLDDGEVRDKELQTRARIAIAQMRQREREQGRER